MKKFLLLFITIYFITLQSFATHNRAGEITYKQISEFTYEITLTTYTSIRPGVVADRPQLDIYWGDGTYTTVPRIEETELPNYYKKNVYVWTHTFPGPGTYQIYMEDPNRNAGVQNIPGSVNTVFAVKTTLQINPFVGHNNTPVLLNPPIDKAAKNHVFIHNPAAFDPDGDSLAYRMTTCLTENGQPIENYRLPSATDTIYVDPITGDLVWNTPDTVGIFNVAMVIEEWRNGVKIGEIIRDMQIEVYDTDNNPPEIFDLEDLCVLAGDTVRVPVTAIDRDTVILADTLFLNNDTIIDIDTIYDKVTLTADGGPFHLEHSPATFQKATAYHKVTSWFSWATDCYHIRKQPYLVIFKAEDNAKIRDDKGNLVEFHLVDFKNMHITIVAPPPLNPRTRPTNRTITLFWDKPEFCDGAVGYRIYRRERPYGFIPDECETGVPEYTGYEFIGTVEGIETTQFLDSNDGEGLWQGKEYCYMITAYYPDGAESYASVEICDNLVRGIPIITNVSVRNTDENNGSIYLAWEKPVDYDSIAAPGPYQYAIYRSNDLWGDFNHQIAVLDGIEQTEFIDTLINTAGFPYSYQVVFVNNTPGNKFEIGTPQLASSVFLEINEKAEALDLVFDNNVPWTNQKYEIYGIKAPGEDDVRDTSLFDFIDTTSVIGYLHEGLENGQKYCYYVKSIGEYSVEDIKSPLINYSQIACATPNDTVPPCTPDLTVQSICDSSWNVLRWRNPNNYCSNDAIGYYIYYSATLDGELQRLDSIFNPEDTTYIHELELSLAGCYVVTAFDKYGNESPERPKVCIDKCTSYKLPNVFTPNGDGQNDIFKPFPYYSVEKVDMKIYNRWGNLVFETSDPDINWDGRNQITNKMVSDGVYYYICDVYEMRLTGLEPRNIVGFIHVYTSEVPSVKP